jgi:hypothetical protein
MSAMSLVLAFDDSERAVLAKLLDGEHPILAALRSQLSTLVVGAREASGVGCFTHFAPGPETRAVPSLPPRFVISDVEAAMEGLARGAGFLVFVENGLLTMLEGFSYDEPWPATITGLSLWYRDPARTQVLASLDAPA